MKTNSSVSIRTGVALLLFAVPLLAHHGYAAYDMQTTRSLKGIVTNYMMANPHSQIGIDIKDASGNADHWVVEASFTVRAMKAAGFDFDTLKPGDEITVVYHPVKGTAHAGLLITLTLPDGRVLPKPDGAVDRP